MANKLHKLMINRADLVDRPSNPMARVMLFKSKLSSKDRKDMGDGDFAYVAPDGTKHLPINDANHVRNALARLDQTDISSSAKASARRKINAAAKKYGIDVSKSMLGEEEFMKEFDELTTEFANSIQTSIDKGFIKEQMSEFSDNLNDLLDLAPLAKTEISPIYEKYEKTVDVLAELDKLILGGEISANEVSELLEGLEMADKTDKELIETLKAQLAEKENEIAKAKKDAEDKDAADKKKKKDDQDADDMKKKALDDAKEGIWKGVAPELKAKFEQLEKSAADSEKIAKAAEENAATVKLEKRVSEDLKAVSGGTSVEKTALLREIEKMLPADKFEKLYTILKDASVAIEKGELLNERGSGGSGKSGSTAFEKIKAQAKQMVTDKLAKTEAEAIAKVAKANPALYKDYLEEQN